MTRRRLGAAGPEVSTLGLGCWSRDERESVATTRAALDAGINRLDIGDFYGMGHNELLLPRPDGTWLGYDARPASSASGPSPTNTSASTVAGERYDAAQLAHLDSER